MFVTLSALTPPGAAIQEAEVELSTSPAAPWFPGAALIALLLVAAHLLAPRMRGWLRAREAAVGSFGGGLAASYVFLHLIPELERGHALLGALIFLVPLLGFVVYYVLDKRFRAARPDSGWSFAQRLTDLAVYNALFVYGVPEIGLEVGLLAIPVGLAILIHLIHSDYGFGAEFPARFDSTGRYVLAAAVLAGYLAVLLEQRTNETLSDLMTAFLAGSVLYNVFRDEIPEERASHIGWFLAGVLGFAVSAIFTLS